MARQTLNRPINDEYDRRFVDGLVGELEHRDGLNFKKGERIEANGGDQTEVVLVSANGTKYKLEVSDAGSITATAVI
jgi:hypothetical protein